MPTLNGAGQTAPPRLLGRVVGHAPGRASHCGRPDPGRPTPPRRPRRLVPWPLPSSSKPTLTERRRTVWLEPSTKVLDRFDQPLQVSVHPVHAPRQRLGVAAQQAVSFVLRPAHQFPFCPPYVPLFILTEVPRRTIVVGILTEAVVLWLAATEALVVHEATVSLGLAA